MMTCYPQLGISLLFLLTLPLYGQAETLTGKVVKIADGDTLSILDAGQKVHKVRLVGIDAPEHDQPFGDKSSENLTKLVAGQQVEVLWTKRDRYHRILGKVIEDGRDINLAQIKAGMAWWYWQHASDQSWLDQIIYATTHAMAWLADTGLWAEPNPVPPWEWRKR